MQLKQTGDLDAECVQKNNKEKSSKKNKVSKPKKEKHKKCIDKSTIKSENEVSVGLVVTKKLDTKKLNIKVEKVHDNKMTETPIEKPIKKREKKKLKDVENDIMEVETNANNNEKTTTLDGKMTEAEISIKKSIKKKKKSKRKLKEMENGVEIDIIGVNNTAMDSNIPYAEIAIEKKPVKKKKKTKKNLNEGNDIGIVTTEVEKTVENKKRKKSKKIVTVNESFNDKKKSKLKETKNTSTSITLENTTKRRKKKKNKKDVENTSSNLIILGVNETLASKTGMEELDSKSTSPQNESNISVSDELKNNKRKRKSSAITQDDTSADFPVKKKKRKKAMHKEITSSEASVVANMKGHISGNDVLDKPKKDGQHQIVTGEEHLDTDKLGQWKTAKLASSAQQDKFARLLGCAKSKDSAETSLTQTNCQSLLSKLTGVWKPPQGRKLWGTLQNNNKTFSTMAPDENESKKLANNLETQYNQTLSFNLQKRKEGNAAKGLGFEEDPAKGKINYIDIHKMKSIALD
ncbi:uncharacterized protein LOC120327500 isoform X2 [Styela clava]